MSETIVLVHGLWMTPLSWEGWVDRFHTTPPASTRANAKLQRRSQAVTEYKEYADRSHYTVGQDGWETVADHALEWAVAQAATRAVPH